MTEILSMHNVKPARLVTNKERKNVWRCEWGTPDGRECQETFGVVEIYRSADGKTIYPRIRLASGYEARPEGHPDVGAYFFTNRPANRTYRSKEIKQKANDTIKALNTEKGQAVLKQFIESPHMTEAEEDAARAKLMEVNGESQRNIDGNAQLKREEKERRDTHEYYLINSPSPWGNGLLGPAEGVLPINIRCKACKRSSKIAVAGEVPR